MIHYLNSYNIIVLFVVQCIAAYFKIDENAGPTNIIHIT